MKTKTKILNAVVAFGVLVTISSCQQVLDPLQRICNETTVGVNTTLEGDDANVLCDGTISCTVRKAIYTANHTCVSKTIILQAGVTYTITAHETGAEATSVATNAGSMAFPPITGNVTIEGNGAVIERDSTVSDFFRLFYIKAGGSLTLRNVTIQGGNLGDYANSNAHDQLTGGAILNEGSLILDNATFYHNHALKQGGAIYNKGALTVSNTTFKYNMANGTGVTNYTTGGAIFSNGTANLHDSYFVQNAANGHEGGAVAFESSFSVSNCLFEKNSAANGGFGLYTTASGSITNCTFYQNSSTLEDNGVIAAEGALNLDISFCTFSQNINGNQYGDCIYLASPTTATISNCIFDANMPHNIYAESSITFSGTNISSDNWVTTISNPNTNPLLGPLSANGGYTKTMVPMAGSPAIDAVTDCGTTNTDQRGNTRPVDGNGDGIAKGDAGAVEVSH